MGKRYAAATATEEKTFTIETAAGDQVFRCVAAVPGAVILDFSLGTSIDPDVPMTQAEQTAAGARTMHQISEFLRTAIVEEDWDRYVQVTRDTTPGNVVELPTLMLIASDLAAEYSNPTSESSPSSSPPNPTGAGSTAGRSPAGTTFSRSKTRPALSTS